MRKKPTKQRERITIKHLTACFASNMKRMRKRRRKKRKNVRRKKYSSSAREMRRPKIRPKCGSRCITNNDSYPSTTN